MATAMLASRALGGWSSTSRLATTSSSSQSRASSRWRHGNAGLARYRSQAGFLDGEDERCVTDSRKYRLLAALGTEARSQDGRDAGNSFAAGLIFCDLRPSPSRCPDADPSAAANVLPRCRESDRRGREAAGHMTTADLLEQPYASRTDRCTGVTMSGGRNLVQDGVRVSIPPGIYVGRTGDNEPRRDSRKISPAGRFHAVAACQAANGRTGVPKRE
jgi:hypothetical protein